VVRHGIPFIASQERNLHPKRIASIGQHTWSALTAALTARQGTASPAAHRSAGAIKLIYVCRHQAPQILACIKVQSLSYGVSPLGSGSEAERQLSSACTATTRPPNCKCMVRVRGGAVIVHNVTIICAQDEDQDKPKC
jgi:hypothetical protein